MTGGGALFQLQLIADDLEQAGCIIFDGEGESLAPIRIASGKQRHRRASRILCDHVAGKRNICRRLIDGCAIIEWQPIGILRRRAARILNTRRILRHGITGEFTPTGAGLTMRRFIRFNARRNAIGVDTASGAVISSASGLAHTCIRAGFVNIS